MLVEQVLGGGGLWGRSVALSLATFSGVNRVSQVSQTVTNLPAMQETGV